MTKPDDIEVRVSDGAVELRCSVCDGYVCDLDDGDSIAVLVGMAEDHVDVCPAGGVSGGGGEA